MKAKRLFAVLLTVVMAVSLFAGCTNSEGGGASTSEAISSTPASSSEAGTESTSTESGDPGSWDGDISEINIMLMDQTGVSETAQDVVDALNELTEKTIGVTANITYVTSGDYISKFNLAISGGEQVDLSMIAPVTGGLFSSLYSNSQLMDITDYLAEEGQDLLDLLGDYASVYSIDGRSYGVPGYRNFATSMYWVMRKDILEELDLVETAQNVKTWTDVEGIFQAVSENTDLAPVAGAKQIFNDVGVIFGDETIANYTTYDCLGDGSGVYADDEGNVSLLYEQEGFRTQLERIRTWYDNGWVYKDSVVTSDLGDILLKTGVTFSIITGGEIGIETSKQQFTGYEVVCVELGKIPVSTSSVSKFGMAVPVTAQEPEAAVRWLNELYTNADMTNLLVWGIEGTDYELVNGEADYPEGIDAQNVNYHTADFMYGNQFLAHPWAGSGADFRDVVYENLENAPISPYLGFSADQSELTNVIAALTSVYSEYSARILCGAYTDEDYENLLTGLKNAGIEEYLQAYEDQLHEWLEAK